MISRFFVFLMLVVSPVVFAEAKKIGLAQLSDVMMDPVYIFSDFLTVACYIVGGSFLFASIIKYMEHRVNPLMVTLSTVIWLFISGLTLVCLPFLNQFTDFVNH